MRYSELFEDAHYDMAHEVLTGHGLERDPISASYGKQSYHKRFSDYPEQQTAYHGIKDNLKAMGWRHLPVQGIQGSDSSTATDHFAHPDSSHKYLTLKTHRHGSVTADMNHDQVGIMSGTIRKLGENEVATNCAGSGAVEGMGVGPKGEPGYPKSKKRGVTLRGILSVKGMTSDGDGK